MAQTAAEGKKVVKDMEKLEKKKVREAKASEQPKKKKQKIN